MNIKPTTLNDLINKSIRLVGSMPLITEEAFAIYEDTRLQVQIVVTKDKAEFCDQILPEYVNSEEVLLNDDEGPPSIPQPGPSS